MRNGKLLAEDSPLQLLTIYGLETLEQVFLKLCVKDDKDSTTTSSSADQICQKPPLLHSWTGNRSFQGRDTKLERFLAKNQLHSNEITKF